MKLVVRNFFVRVSKVKIRNDNISVADGGFLVQCFIHIRLDIIITIDKADVIAGCLFNSIIPD
ncbi:hypothetical protein SDC9_135618 [bioreactor metagenome]|uniref:Uncharacterized protein n=1 Tax=bioreactor metagenome TaxID=1076179 RepID=A0A645DGC3_9ZZZZ